MQEAPGSQTPATDGVHQQTATCRRRVARFAHAARARRDRLFEPVGSRRGDAGRWLGAGSPTSFESRFDDLARPAGHPASQERVVPVPLRRAQPARHVRSQARGSCRVPRRVPPHRHHHQRRVPLRALAEAGRADATLRAGALAVLQSRLRRPSAGRARTAGRHRRIAPRRHAGRFAPRLALLGLGRRVHAPGRDGLPSGVVLPGDVVDPGTGLYPGQNAGLLGASTIPSGCVAIRPTRSITSTTACGCPPA